ncbi:MAG TPA: bifunctional glutamate N-acetyltransferase/amino-acid acetyltransferase ArgJ [Actinomycetota bacterium]|nr:bifunctional glutamate N-acetyltransferase/amino-acid acetyltransferase ArgJ [Actinomycetota bacterium]
MTLPFGFTYAGVAAGLKPGGALDMGLIVSDRPAVAAGVVTANTFQAAPIVVSKKHLRRGAARAIVVNAGNANACTGPLGIADAEAMAADTAAALGVGAEQVLVASTGVIGRRMDMPKIRTGIAAAAAALGAEPAAFASAIMTTDTRAKIAEATAGDAAVYGIAKGAGMIAPEMATMLCFILTDAPASRSVLAAALQRASAESFNRISVDGCMSTNDCIFALANGTAGGEIIERGDPREAALADAIGQVCRSLARQIVEDGEGATKVVEITVRGATSEREALVAARAIAGSVLLRCAIGGADPNWGRVLAALGTAPIPFDPHRVDVWLGGEKVAEKGAIGPGDLDKAAAAMKDRDVEVLVDMRRGRHAATILTNDMTAEYVSINGDYTS